MNRPIISIIIPCYNSSKYIKKAITSIYCQNYDNWELIVINDGSTDNTLDIVNSFAKKDKRIRVYSKDNGGYPTAINYALDRINGLYFTILGSDDEFFPNLFNKCCCYLESLEYDCVYFRAIKYYQDKPTPDPRSNFDKIYSYKNKNILEVEKSMPKEYSLPFDRDTSRFYRVECIKNIRYYGTVGIGSDTVFSLLFNHNVYSFLFLPIDGYKWYLRTDSISHTIKNFDDLIFVWTQYFKYIVNKSINNITDNEKFVYSKIILEILKNYSNTFLNIKKIII